jgi:serine protease inhibitor
MRQLVVSIAAVLLLAGAAPKIAPVNYDAFGISVLQQAVRASKTDNIFLSPVSIGMAMSMAADGARGATRSGIVRALNVDPKTLAAKNAALIAELGQNTDATVGIANALWLRSDLPPRAAYSSLVKSNYRAEAQAVQFGNPSAAQAINAWTKQHTLGLIDNIVETTSPRDFAYLTNALAFQAKWMSQFKKNDTRRASFTDADGTKHDVDMMSQTGTFSTLDVQTFSAIRLPYGNGGYAAYIMLPRTSDVESIVSKLTTTGFNNMTRSMQSGRVALSLPRFTAQYDASLVALLKSLGMSVAFSDRADFSGIHAAPPRLQISQVRHSAYVRVDEEGTTAAAATSVGITTTAIEVPPKAFVVDHPFVLALRDERTGTLLFIGAIRRIPAPPATPSPSP